MKIIGISGKKGSGKDTFAQFLKEELEKQLGKTVKVDSFAANLKRFKISIFFYMKKDKKFLSHLSFYNKSIFFIKTNTDIFST